MKKAITRNVSRLTIILLMGICSPAIAQLGVGTTTPNPSAMLDVVSTTQGALLPRMSSTQMGNISNAATGLLVYCTDCSPAGLYHYNGSSWVSITDLNYQTSNFSAGDNLGDHTATQTLKLRNNKIVGGTASTDGTDGISIAQDGGVTFGNGVAVKAFSSNPNLGGSNASNDSVATQSAVRSFVNNNRGLIDEGSGNLHGGGNLQNVTTGFGNLALGGSVLGAVTTGIYNTSVGAVSGTYLTTGNYNTFMGVSSGRLTSTGSNNVAMGMNTLFHNATGAGNTAIGAGAGNKMTNASHNVLIGYQTATHNLNSYNTIIGAQAGLNSNTNASVYLGFQAGFHDTLGGQHLWIANTGDVNLTPLVGGDFLKKKVGINMHIDSLNQDSRATFQVGGDMQLQNGIKVNEFSAQTDLGASSPSDNVVSTQKAVKAYVDNTVKPYSTRSDLAGANASDDSVATQKAVKAYVDNTVKPYSTRSDLAGANASDDSVATQKAVKAYVDNNVKPFSTRTDLAGANASDDSVATQKAVKAFVDNTVKPYSTRGDLAGTNASDDSVATQKAVKAYVDQYGGLLVDAATPTPNIYGDTSNFGTLTSAAVGNTALGHEALGSLTSGQNNTAIGPLAGNAQTTSGSNAFVGSEAGRYRTGHSNIALGHNAFIGSALTQSGDENVMIGKNTGDVLDANQSVYIGNNAGFLSTGGSASVKIGYRSGQQRNGYGNVMIGFDAAGGNPGVAGDDGTLNTFIGTGAGYNSKGSSNVMIGRNAGFHNDGSFNVLLGPSAGVNNSGDHKLYIESTNTNSPLIGGDFSQNKLGVNVDVTTLNSSSATLTIGGDLQVGTTGGVGLEANSGTLNIDGGINLNGSGSVAINKFSNDPIGTSTTSVPTENAVKTFVEGIVTGPSDNLGNHTATTNITLGTNEIHGAGTEGIKVESDGKLLLTAGDQVVGNSNVAINEFSTDNTLGGATPSDDAIPTEKAVKSYVDANFVQTEVDGDASNELQDLSLTANTLSLTNDPSTVDLSGYLDNTDDQQISRSDLTVTLENGGTFQDSVNIQTIDHLELFGSDLRISLSDDGQAWQSVSLASLTDGMGNHTASQDIRLGNYKLLGAGSGGLSISPGGALKLGGGSYVDQFSTASDLGASTIPSDYAVPTQKAVKTYVDGQISSLGSLAGLIEANVNHSVHGNTGNFLNQSGTGARNTAIGYNAMRDGSYLSTSSHDNTAVGYAAGQSMTSTGNTVIGASAGVSISGASNTAIGKDALKSSPGHSNVAIGAGAMDNLVGGGHYNTAIGAGAGAGANGTRNVLIGYQAGQSAGGDDKLYIENSNSSTPLIGGNFAGNRVGINRSIGSLGSGATLQVGGDIQLASGAAISNFSAATDLGGVSASDNAVATQKAVKTYLDNQGFHQDLDLSGNTLSLTGDATSVDLASFMDNTDDQNIDHFALNGTDLELSIESDGQANQTVDMSAFMDNTDDQTIDLFNLNGNNLELSLESDGQAAQVVDLSSFLDADDLGDHKADMNLDLGTNQLVGNGGSSGISIAANGGVRLATGAYVTEFSTDVTLGGVSPSNSAIPTEAAVHAYVQGIANNNGGLLVTGSRNTSGGNLNFQQIQSGAVDNTGLGNGALKSIQTGDNNVSVGESALEDLTTGGSNTAMGYSAGLKSNGSGNVFIGSYAGFQETSANSLLYIESDFSANNSSTPLIGGNFANNRVGINRGISSLYSGATFQVGGDASKSVAGSWSANSDSRLKTNIRYMDSEAMLQSMLKMRGATYEWNDTVTGTPRPEGIQYGFIAQDIEKVWPSKITHDGQGYLMTAYGDYDPMFVESIRALYNRIEELEKENAELKANSTQELQSMKEQISKLEEMMKSVVGEDVSAGK